MKTDEQGFACVNDKPGVLKDRSSSVHPLNLSIIEINYLIEAVCRHGGWAGTCGYNWVIELF